jgi:hypothetical protein
MNKKVCEYIFFSLVLLYGKEELSGTSNGRELMYQEA